MSKYNEENVKNNPIKLPEVINSLPVMKISLDGIESKVNISRGEMEGRRHRTRNYKLSKMKHRKNKINLQNPIVLWDNIKQPNIYVLWSHE